MAAGRRSPWRRTRQARQRGTASVSSAGGAVFPASARTTDNRLWSAGRRTPCVARIIDVAWSHTFTLFPGVLASWGNGLGKECPKGGGDDNLNTPVQGCTTK